jgi:hypothetical protein
MDRGSRKHVLDWTGSPSFVDELQAMLGLDCVSFAADSQFMPKGAAGRREARLERLKAEWQLGSHVVSELQKWWLVHPRGANTPNWDIAAACDTSAGPGLVLVEAKAHRREFNWAGKPLSKEASGRSRENHERIGHAIEEACAGWQELDPRVSISRDSHYQLANRLAFAWKLATLRIPTILVFLGFVGDGGIVDAGEPFEGISDWECAFADYIATVFPTDLLGKRLYLDATPLCVLSRTREVSEPSPPLLA